jgi:hypothetical protein
VPILRIATMGGIVVPIVVVVDLGIKCFRRSRSMGEVVEPLATR